MSRRTLIRVSKQRNLPVLLVGHVTKDGSIAGPRLLEHLVDVVLHFEGDRQTSLRFVRSHKNRFGPTDEVGCFEMTGEGISEVADPSGLFLSGNRNRAAVSGTCVTIAVEGRRALPVEVQALIVKTQAPQPRRVVNGVDSSRVAMLLAVLERRASLQLSGADVYVSTVGGIRLTEPGADLAIALAIASAFRERALRGHPRGDRRDQPRRRDPHRIQREAALGRGTTAGLQHDHRRGDAEPQGCPQARVLVSGRRSPGHTRLLVEPQRFDPDNSVGAGDAKRGERARLESCERDLLVAALAHAVAALIHAPDRLADVDEVRARLVQHHGRL